MLLLYMYIELLPTHTHAWPSIATSLDLATYAPTV